LTQTAWARQVFLRREVVAVVDEPVNLEAI